MIDKIANFDLSRLNFARWRSVSAFKKQRANFFVDAGRVLGSVKLVYLLKKRADTNRGTPLGDAYSDILESYRRGAVLSEAFGPYLLDGERLAMSGWDSTQSDKELASGFAMLGQIATAFDKIKKEFWKTVSVTVYSVTLVIGMLSVLDKQIYPFFLHSFPLSKWGFAERIVYYIVHTLFSNVYLLGIGIAVIVAISIWALPNWSSPVRRRLDHTFLMSWYRGFRSLQILLPLALHLQSKRGLSQSLRLIKEEANPWESWYLDEMRLNSEQGGGAEEVFDVGFFDHEIVDRLVLLSLDGSVERALQEIAFVAQKDLLDDFQAKLSLGALFVKNASLLCGGVPFAMIFVTLGQYISAAASTGFKMH